MSRRRYPTIRDLEYFFHYNFVPSVRLELAPAALRAIKNASKGLWDKKVRIPGCYSWEKSKLIPTWGICEELRLYLFIPNE